MLRGFGINNILRIAKGAVAVSLLASLAIGKCYAKSNSHSQSRLLMDKNMYTGKSGWIYNYHFFPEIDSRLGDPEEVHIQEEYFEHKLMFFLDLGYGGAVGNDADVTFKQRNNYGFGINHIHFFNPHFGFKVGFDLNITTSESIFHSYSDKYSITDSEMDKSTYSYTIGTVHEDYIFYQVNIPVQFVYCHKQLMASLGVKGGIPFFIQYDQKAYDIYQEAYYPAYGVTVDDSWALRCGKYTQLGTKSGFTQSSLFVMVAGDVSWSFNVGDKNSIGIGIYGEYAFVGLAPKNTHDINYNKLKNYQTGTLLSVTKDEPKDFHAESVLSSMYSDHNSKIVRNMGYVTLGLRVSYEINNAPRKTTHIKRK